MRNKYKCQLIALCLLLFHFGFSQISTFHLGDLELKSIGNRISLLKKAQIGKLAFHVSVGGISFEQIATPDNAIAGYPITLRYEKAQSDGKHLKISIGSNINSNYYVNLPDWQLIPLVKYANDTNNAVFTLIGNTNNENLYSYHPAFDSSLLGLRMFQADLLFSSYGGASLSDLPRDSNNKLLLADSELRFKKINKKFEEYENLYQELEDELPYFTSYILTDWGEEIKFGIAGNDFYITGEPYYLFTSNITDQTTTNFRIISNIFDLRAAYPFINDPSFIEISNYFHKQKLNSDDIINIGSNFLELFLKYEEPYSSWFYSLYQEFDGAIYSGAIDEHIKKTKNEFLELDKEAPFLNDSDFVSICNLYNQDLYSWTANDIYQSLYSLSLKYSKPFSTWFIALRSNLYQSFDPYNNFDKNYKVELQLCNSQRLQELNQKIFEFNPVVFNSCITAMRYAAFFRYVKAHNPQSWKEFVSEINTVKKIFPSPDPMNPVNKGIVPPNKISLGDE
jgi:hypothetical protein